MKSTAPKTSICGGGAKHSMNTRHGILAGLAMGAVVAHDRDARLELTEGVADDDPVEVGVAEDAERVELVADQHLAPRPRALDDGGQRHRPVLGHGVAPGLVDERFGHVALTSRGAR